MNSRAPRPNGRRIGWLVAGNAAFLVACWALLRGGSTPAADDDPLADRILVSAGRFEGGVTSFYTPRVRRIADPEEVRGVLGWQVCGMADSTSMVALREEEPRGAAPRTLWAVPVPPATSYDPAGDGWTEFR